MTGSNPHPPPTASDHPPAMAPAALLRYLLTCLREQLTQYTALAPTPEFLTDDNFSPHRPASACARRGVIDHRSIYRSTVRMRTVGVEPAITDAFPENQTPVLYYTGEATT
jgi:hypothetical protein